MDTRALTQDIPADVVAAAKLVADYNQQLHAATKALFNEAYERNSQGEEFGNQLIHSGRITDRIVELQEILYPISE